MYGRELAEAHMEACIKVGSARNVAFLISLHCYLQLPFDIATCCRTISSTCPCFSVVLSRASAP